MEPQLSGQQSFHNRFAMNDTTNTALNEGAKEGEGQQPSFDFNFKDFTDFATIPAEPEVVQENTVPSNEKQPELAPIISSAEAYARVEPPGPSHVAALEAAAEEESNNLQGTQGTQDLERTFSSSASMYAPTSPTGSVQTSTSNFQQALNGSSSRFSSSSHQAKPATAETSLPPLGRIIPGPASSAAAQRQRTASQSGPIAFPGSSTTLEEAIGQMNLNGKGGRAPDPGVYGTMPRVHHDSTTRSRPSSFFGLERPSAAIEAAAGGIHAFPTSARTGSDAPTLATATAAATIDDDQDDDDDSNNARKRHSSFFGMEEPIGHIPTADRSNEGQTQAARIAASHRNAELNYDAGAISSAGSIQGGVAGSGSNSTTRPASIAATTSGALLDHSHLKPGLQAALLSHNKTLELYRQNAKKTNDPNLIYEFAVFMVDASKSMGSDESSGGSGGANGTDYTGKEEHAREELAREATGLLKKIAERGHMDAQYFLADCYANGIGSPKGKQDFDRAYPLFVLAAKHGHPDAAYRAGTCYEKGWGCRKDPAKALQFYRKAASQSHPGAMYRLATAELNGDLGLKKSAREGVKWLKRSAESATPEFPHALHELALLHERGIDNVLFVDEEYACELLAQSAEMGYAPSAYKLGVNYEYGRMGCPQDGGLSIHMYNIAAQQNHKEACFALTAWYLVGAPGILPQSDTEAYLWAKKAAEQGLAKAEYAVGYFTEMGIGTVKDVAEARAWYRAAAEHGDKRANQRLSALGGQPVPMANEMAGGKDEPSRPSGQAFASQHAMGPQQGGRPPQQQQQGPRNGSGPGGPPMRPVPMSAREQGQRIAAEQTQRMIAQAEMARQQGVPQGMPPGMRPPPMGNGPMSPGSERASLFMTPPGSDRASMMSPPGSDRASIMSPPGSHYAPSIASRDPQQAQREHAFQMAVQQQQQQRNRGSPAGSQQHRIPHGSDSAYTQQNPHAHHGPSARPPQMLPGGIPFIPSNKPYPVYTGQVDSANPIPMPPAPREHTPPPQQQQQQAPAAGQGNEKKKGSLWSQIKQM